MNQLGKKLRKQISTNLIKSQNKRGSDGLSSSNRKLSSISSEFDSEKGRASNTKDVTPMSPIKRRKEIGSPNLNEEQNYFLKL